MMKNVGAIDRVIRLIIGIALLYAGYVLGISTTLGIVLIVLGVISLIEALVGFCLIYKILGINTAKPKAPEQTIPPQQTQ